jgi:hypothetical protein
MKKGSQAGAFFHFKNVEIKILSMLVADYIWRLKQTLTCIQTITTHE